MATAINKTQSSDDLAKPKPLSLKKRHEMIVQYTPYVRSIASKIKKTLSKDIEFDDLVEYGMIGLLEAAERYNPNAGANFMTFSFYRIRGAIYDGLRGMGWLNRTEYARVRYEEKANLYLAQVVEDKVLAEATNNHAAESFEGLKTDAKQEKLVSHLATIFVTTMEGMENLQVKDENTPAPDSNIEQTQMRKQVKRAIAKLNTEEKSLLDLYYFRELSLEEVGKRLGLSKSWTSRLHARVIERLQRLLKEENPDLV